MAYSVFIIKAYIKIIIVQMMDFFHRVLLEISEMHKKTGGCQAAGFEIC